MIQLTIKIARAPAAAFCARIILRSVTFAVAAPAVAQSVLSPDPMPGATTCAEFTAMSSAARLQSLTAIQPLGDDIEGADPAMAGQWSDEVAAACARDPELPLADAADQALGGD
jgi:hypothetical protein